MRLDRRFGRIGRLNKLAGARDDSADDLLENLYAPSLPPSE